MILDAVFIAGFKWGITGAAIATVFAQMISMALGQYILFKGKHPVKVKFRGWKTEKNIIKDNSNAGAYNRCIACCISYIYRCKACT